MYEIGVTPNKIMRQLSERLKSIRKTQNFTQQELADRSGVSLGSLKRFEHTGQISLQSLLKLLHVLNRLEEFENLLLPKEDSKDIEGLFSDDL